MILRCTKCNKEINIFTDEQIKFCPFCGSSFDNANSIIEVIDRIWGETAYKKRNYEDNILELFSILKSKANNRINNIINKHKIDAPISEYFQRLYSSKSLKDVLDKLEFYITIVGERINSLQEKTKIDLNEAKIEDLKEPINLLLNDLNIDYAFYVDMGYILKESPYSLELLKQFYSKYVIYYQQFLKYYMYDDVYQIMPTSSIIEDFSLKHDYNLDEFFYDSEEDICFFDDEKIMYDLTIELKNITEICEQELPIGIDEDHSDFYQNFWRVTGIISNCLNTFENLNLHYVNWDVFENVERIILSRIHETNFNLNDNLLKSVEELLQKFKKKE